MDEFGEESVRELELEGAGSEASACTLAVHGPNIGFACWLLKVAFCQQFSLQVPSFMFLLSFNLSRGRQFSQLVKL